MDLLRIVSASWNLRHAENSGPAYQIRVGFQHSIASMDLLPSALKSLMR